MNGFIYQFHSHNNLLSKLTASINNIVIDAIVNYTMVKSMKIKSPRGDSRQ